MPPIQDDNNMPKENKYRCTFVIEPKRSTLQTKNCLIPFSMFSDYHEKEQLQAQMELINNIKFLNKYYLLGDSLYAHNLAMEKHLELNEKIRKDAHDIGDKWLKANHEALSKIPVGNIHRWNNLLTIKECQDYITTVRALFENDSPLRNTYQTAVNETVDIVFNRFKKRNAKLVEDDKSYILNYILEECGVLAYYIKTNNIKYITYPQSIPSAFSATIQILLMDMKVNWLEVKISKNKANTIKKSQQSNVKVSREPLRHLKNSSEASKAITPTPSSMPRVGSLPNLQLAVLYKKSSELDDNNRLRTSKSPIYPRRNEQIKNSPSNNIKLFNSFELDICLIDQKALKKLEERVIRNSQMTKSQKSKYLKNQVNELQKIQSDLINHIIFIGTEDANIEQQTSLGLR